MSLGFKIWLISAIYRTTAMVQFITFFVLFISLFMLVVTISDGCYYDEYESGMLRTKISIIISIAILIITAMVPSKSEMYIIAFTKNVTEQEVYNMTKEELKAGIDYMITELKDIE